MDELRVKHLEMIQNVISRLNTNSFLVKGWTLTIAGLIYVYAAGRNGWQAAAIGTTAAFAFWTLDAYLLYSERMFRQLYDDARQIDSHVDLFSMQVAAYKGSRLWMSTAFSLTMISFYIPVLLIGVGLLSAGV